MCGRYTITTAAKEIGWLFDVEVPEPYQPRFNAAPSQLLPVISNVRQKKISLFNWGIVPYWAKDKGGTQMLINARAETVAEKPTFKNAFRKRRCLVIADGYYEWKKESKGKVPYRILLKNEKPFAFAGIWEKSDDEEPSFVIITVKAAPSIAEIHDRMPGILDEAAREFWLSDSEDYEGLTDILRHQPDENLKAYVVSKEVNSARNDSEELVIPQKN